MNNFMPISLKTYMKWTNSLKDQKKIFKKIDYLNFLISATEIENIVKHLPTKKIPGSEGFTDKFYQMLNEEIRPTNSTQTLTESEKGILPNAFFEASKKTKDQDTS